MDLSQKMCGECNYGNKPIMEYRCYLYVFDEIKKVSAACGGFWLARKVLILCHMTAHHYIHYSQIVTLNGLPIFLFFDWDEEL